LSEEKDQNEILPSFAVTPTQLLLNVHRKKKSHTQQLKAILSMWAF